MKAIEKMLKELASLKKSYKDSEKAMLETRNNNAYDKEEARQMLIIEKMHDISKELQWTLEIRHDLNIELARPEVRSLKKVVTI